MKLLLITTVAEFKKDIYQLFKKANITVYSTTNIDGHKFSDEKDLQSSWFISSEASLKSIMYFSFCSEDKANKMLSELEAYNKTKRTNNPAKAVVLPVEKFI